MPLKTSQRKSCKAFKYNIVEYNLEMFNIYMRCV